MRLRKRKPTIGVVVVELGMTNGVPIVYLPAAATADQLQFVGEWVKACAGNREELAREVSKIIARRQRASLLAGGVKRA